MNLNKLWKTVKDREARQATFHGVAKSRAWLSNWTATEVGAGKRLWQRHTERESGEAWCVSAVLSSSGRNSISCRACDGRICWALPQSFWFCRSERDASFVLLSVQMMRMLLGWWLSFEHHWLKLLLPTPQVILSAELEARRTQRISLELGPWFWAKEDRYPGLLWKFESVRASWAWGWQSHSKILPPREKPVTSTCFLGT